MQDTVAIVDDDPSVRVGIANLLRASGYATTVFASAEEFLDRSGNGANCLLLDLQMPQTSGLELQQRLMEQNCQLPIVFLTGYGDVPSTATALKSGAVDFLEKPVDEVALLSAVEEALQRDRAHRKKRAEIAAIEVRFARLTAREVEVLRFVIGGCLNKQIAGALGISEKTVKVHRARVMEKMAATSVAGLVRLTGKLGLEPADSRTGWG